MFRFLSVTKVLICCCLIGGLLQIGACGPGESNEPSPEKTVDGGKEEVPETGPQESTPDVRKPPKDVGKPCVSGPRGDNCPKDQNLLCVITSSTQGVCLENCTSDPCANPDDVCKPDSRGFKACYKIANKGETCGTKERKVCREESVDPPEYCISGKCQDRPKDGWGENQACSPPGSNEQSDCKDGLICVSIASGLYKCLKKCSGDGDCSGGKVCWDEPLKKKVCVFAMKPGDECDRLALKFCRPNDPKKPVECKAKKCQSTTQYKQVGEECSQSFDPNDKRGNCDFGMVCLGVDNFKSGCHKSCKATSECPSGEVCTLQPNDGKPERVCMKPAKVGEECNLIERKICVSSGSQILKCKPKEENKAPGTCTEVNIGDKCEGSRDCGPMACIAVDPNQAQIKYCLLPCDPKAPKCPGNGACIPWGQNGPVACMPTGKNKEDEPCNALQAGGEKLNTSTLCAGGLNCIVFERGKTAGVCMKRVGQCSAGACDSAHVCIPVQGAGLCGRDCSKGPSACLPGTKCFELQGGVKACGPT